MDARKASREGAFFVRTNTRDGARDWGYVDRGDLLAGEGGRKATGLAIAEGDSIELLMPGGIPGDFSVDVIRVDRGRADSGQHVGGPGGADALIPHIGSFPPVVGCANATAEIDFESSIDGTTYDLLGMTYTFETPLVPELDPAVRPTFTMELSPHGSRAAAVEDLVVEDLVVEDLPTGGMPTAIALRVDLSQLSLGGDSGYRFRERPYGVDGMSRLSGSMGSSRSIAMSRRSCSVRPAGSRTKGPDPWDTT